MRVSVINREHISVSMDMLKEIHHNVLILPW